MLYFGAMVLPLCKKIITFAQSERSNGGIGRHEGLKIPWPLRLCGFKSRFEYEIKLCESMIYGAFSFCALYWIYPYYIQFMRFWGSQLNRKLNHELNPNAV